MGTELALHLLKEHDLVVWNRTSSKTERLVAAGATLASSPEEAVAGADIIVTSLFGPDTVRDVVINPRLIPEGVLWVDTTTVSPEDCTEFAEAVPSYVAAPVVGTLGPARAGSLGVYVAAPMSITVMPLPHSSPRGQTPNGLCLPTPPPKPPSENC